MALWAGTTINNTAVAMMFNRLYNMKSVNMVSKDTGLLYLIRGNSNIEMDSQGNPKLSWDRQTGGASIQGNKLEVRMLGKLVTWGSYADYTDEVATTNLANSADYWGAAVFDLGHFGYTHPVPESEFQRILGNEAKTKDFIAETFDMLMASKEDYLATALNAAGAGLGGSRTVLGAWQHAVSDGISAGETNYSTYGTIDRSDNGNANYRSYVVPALGNLDLAKLQAAKNKAKTNRGKVDLCEMGITQFNKLQQLLQGYTVISYDAKFAEFGSEYFKFANMWCCLDAYCPDGVIGGLDTSKFVWIEKEQPFNQGGLMEDPSRNATKVIKANSWEQVVTIRPRSHFKLTGITS